MCDRVVCDGEVLPDVFLFLCVRILFLLFDTKTASSTSVYLGRQIVVAINPLHFTYCVERFGNEFLLSFTMCPEWSVLGVECA